MKRHLSITQEASYPLLRRDLYHVTSEYDPKYNCIAHAAGRKDMPWWPVKAQGVYWPPGICMRETIECFVSAYATEGYKECERGDRTLELGIEKIALYIDGGGEPCHAALQLENGHWTSKLGDWEDIEHVTLEALEDDALARGLGYGKAVKILRRSRHIVTGADNEQAST